MRSFSLLRQLVVPQLPELQRVFEAMLDIMGDAVLFDLVVLAVVLGNVFHDFDHRPFVDGGRGHQLILREVGQRRGHRLVYGAKAVPNGLVCVAVLDQRLVRILHI